MSRPRDKAKQLEYQKRYARSAKGKAAAQRYQQSAKGKATYRRYDASLRGQQRYLRAAIRDRIRRHEATKEKLYGPEAQRRPAGTP